MKIAIVGCGFVADYYMATLPLHPELQLVGAYDSARPCLERFTQFHGVPQFDSLEQLLKESSADIVLNLTNPRSHLQVSHDCLQAGKHVYSEKPLAMDMDDAIALAKLADSQGLTLSSAPCSQLSESAQTLWKAIREESVGSVRLVYAELDDGMLHQMPYDQWSSASGAAWPFRDEFEVGCTLEHAGYYLNWLTMIFGPAQSVTSFSDCLIPDKVSEVQLSPNDTPDFSVACIKFRSGVVARLTCSIVAPHDHSLKVVCDDGILSVPDCWYNGSQVSVRKTIRIRRKLMLSPIRRQYRLVRKPRKYAYRGSQQMDFCAGVAELADSLTTGRRCRIGTDVSLHNNELALAIQQAGTSASTHQMTTSFEPCAPMEWAT